MRCHGTVRSTSTSASECWMSRNWDPRCWPEGSTTRPEDYRLGGRWPCGSTSTSDPGRSGCESVRTLDIADRPQLPVTERGRPFPALPGSTWAGYTGDQQCFRAEYQQARVTYTTPSEDLARRHRLLNPEIRGGGDRRKPGAPVGQSGELRWRDAPLFQHRHTHRPGGCRVRPGAPGVAGSITPAGPPGPTGDRQPRYLADGTPTTD